MLVPNLRASSMYSAENHKYRYRQSSRTLRPGTPPIAGRRPNCGFHKQTAPTTMQKQKELKNPPRSRIQGERTKYLYAAFLGPLHSGLNIFSNRSKKTKNVMLVPNLRASSMYSAENHKSRYRQSSRTLRPGAPPIAGRRPNCGFHKQTAPTTTQKQKELKNPPRSRIQGARTKYLYAAFLGPRHSELNIFSNRSKKQKM